MPQDILGLQHLSWRPLREVKRETTGHHHLRRKIADALQDFELGLPLMHILGQFPAVRMRRMRRDDFSRRLMRETAITVDDLIYPVFVMEGERRREAVASMPGVERVTIDELIAVAEECVQLGIPAVALFPVIDTVLKSPDGREATNADGLVPR